MILRNLKPKSPFEFKSPRDYLVELYRRKKQLNPRFSLRIWANQLGLKSPSGLSMILSGKRSIRPEIISKLSTQFSLNQTEETYLQTLNYYTNSKSSKSREEYRLLLSRILAEGHLKGRKKKETFSFLLATDPFEMPAALGLIEAFILKLKKRFSPHHRLGTAERTAKIEIQISSTIDH